jgi:hypothetical protein
MTCERCGTPLHAGRCPRCGPYTNAARVPASWAPGGPPADAVRGDERRSAMRYASGWTVAFGVVALLGTYLVAAVARSHHIESALNSPDYSAGPHPPPPYMLLLLVPGVLCWAACGVAEVLLARTLGGDYPPLGPLAWLPVSTLPERVRRGLGGVDRKLGAGGGCLAVAAFALVGPLVVVTWSAFTSSATVLWLLCLLAATVAHLLYVRSRLGTWRRRRLDA